MPIYTHDMTIPRESLEKRLPRRLKLLGYMEARDLTQVGVGFDHPSGNVVDLANPFGKPLPRATTSLGVNPENWEAVLTAAALFLIWNEDFAEGHLARYTACREASSFAIPSNPREREAKADEWRSSALSKQVAIKDQAAALQSLLKLRCMLGGRQGRQFVDCIADSAAFIELGLGPKQVIHLKGVTSI